MNKKPYRGKGESDDKNVQISKNLAYLLRHGAVKEGLSIRSDGYVKVEDVLKMKFYISAKVDFAKIKDIVDNNDKKRYELSEEEDEKGVKIWWIRAAQGHTIKDVNDEELLEKLTDPKLYPVCVHGTTNEAWPSIKVQGLSRMKRNHVHFAIGYPGEKDVISGMRKSCKVFVEVDLEKAMSDGLEFYLSSNKVILSPGNDQGFIPPKYFKKVIIKEGEFWKEQDLNGSSNPMQEEVKSDEQQQKLANLNTGDFDYLIALDFEAQCQDGVELDVQEIVEFPSVVIDCKEKKIIDRFHYYVKPVVHPKLYPFCTELTGITQDKVDAGLILQDVLKELDKYLTEKKIKDTKWCFVTCGDWDLRSCLKKEARAKSIQVPSYLKSWINLKKVYPGENVRGMVDLLKLSGLELLGKHHSGIDDTVNIARVIVYLLENNFAFKRTMINSIK